MRKCTREGKTIRMIETIEKRRIRIEKGFVSRKTTQFLNNSKKRYKKPSIDNDLNVVQYAALTHMMAQVSGLEVGEFVHVIADCHIYDRHIPAVKAMLEREGFAAPEFKMDKSVTDFYAFTKDSFQMENYQYHSFDFEIPMAI